MTDKRKKGFRTVPSKDAQEFQRELKKHRMDVLKRIIVIAVIVCLLIGTTAIYMSMRQYTQYDVRASAHRQDTRATAFAEFGGLILKYSNDGAFYTDCSNELLWNQTYEMMNPTMDKCGNYLVIYDKGGKNIYLFTKAGLVNSIVTRFPITQVSVAAQGTVAVLTDNQGAGLLTLYDKEGRELVNGALHGSKGGYPIAIALSDDAIKLAVSLLDISGGNVKTTLAFYNFGSVGENAIDHVVSANSYEDMLIPELDFVSEDRMIALADSKVLIFEGEQSPKLVTEIAWEQQVKSVFHNERYIGIVYNQMDAENGYLLRVFDMTGRLMMDESVNVAYSDIELLSNDEICIYNRTVCNIYTIRGIYKFHHEFEKELYYVMSGGSSLNYTFIIEGATEQVRLK